MLDLSRTILMIHLGPGELRRPMPNRSPGNSANSTLCVPVEPARVSQYT